MPPKKPEEPAAEHFEVELTPKMRDALLKFLGGKDISKATHTLIVAQVKRARLIDAPLYAVTLDWAELEAEAKRQGVSVVDVFWDRAGHRG